MFVPLLTAKSFRTLIISLDLSDSGKTLFPLSVFNLQPLSSISSIVSCGVKLYKLLYKSYMLNKVNKRSIFSENIVILHQIWSKSALTKPCPAKH